MEQIYVLYLINVHNFMPDISNTLNYMHVAYKQWIMVHTKIEIFSFELHKAFAGTINWNKQKLT